VELFIGKVVGEESAKSDVEEDVKKKAEIDGENDHEEVGRIKKRELGIGKEGGAREKETIPEGELVVDEELLLDVIKNWPELLLKIVIAIEKKL
jgi:hypothetical protein